MTGTRSSSSASPAAGMWTRGSSPPSPATRRSGKGRSSDGKVAVKTLKGEKQAALAELLADNCLTCRFNEPVMSDIEIGEGDADSGAEKEYEPVTAFENLPAEERWAYFEKEMAKCIRCTACRNVCPSCYCRICFADQSQPRWVDIGDDPSDTQIFQLMRMYHMVGRCVDCGSCTAVCPMGVDLRKFLKKLDKDAFDYVRPPGRRLPGRAGAAQHLQGNRQGRFHLRATAGGVIRSQHEKFSGGSEREDQRGAHPALLPLPEVHGRLPHDLCHGVQPQPGHQDDPDGAGAKRS